MKNFTCLIAVSLVMLAGQAVAQSSSEKWNCTVEQGASLISFFYDGGNYASIHIAPYQSGGSYRVKKVGTDTVIGETADRTKFTCTRQSAVPK